MNSTSSGCCAERSNPAPRSLTPGVFRGDAEGAARTASFGASQLWTPPRAPFFTPLPSWPCPCRDCFFPGRGAGAAQAIPRRVPSPRAAPGVLHPGGKVRSEPCRHHRGVCTGPLLLPEMPAYSISALTCFLNKLLSENALVKAFHALFCMYLAIFVLKLMIYPM